MNDDNDERAGADVSSLLRLGWPIIVSRSTQVVVGLSDALMVAHLGETALAAVTTGAMNAFALFILPMGTVFIVASFASQLFGKGDLAGARRYAFYGLLVALATELACFAGLPWLRPALSLFDFSPDVMEQIQAYLAVRLLAGGLVVGTEALANYYGGLGNTRLPMIVNVVAMVLNVAGNWLLIDGRLGFPALGVAGAAWASLIATGVAFFGFLAVFLADGWAERPGLPLLHLAELARMLRFGLPSGFNWFFEFFAFLFFVNVVVAGLGTTPLAALMAVMQLNSVSFMPSFALASAGAILVGQAIGAGAKDDAPRIVRLTFLVTASWQTAVGLVYLLLPELVFAPFARADGSEALLEVGRRMLMLSAAWQLFDAAATTLAESLRAAGDTAFTLWARVAIAWAIFVPGAWLTVEKMGGGEVAAVLWLVLYLALLAGVLFLRFRQGAWRRLDLVGETML